LSLLWSSCELFEWLLSNFARPLRRRVLKRKEQVLEGKYLLFVLARRGYGRGESDAAGRAPKIWAWKRLPLRKVRTRMGPPVLLRNFMSSWPQ